MQLTLVPDPVPDLPQGITIHCGDVGLVLAERGARLIVADPPWSYNSGKGLRGAAGDIYTCPPMEVIVSVLDRSYDCALDDAYLFLWATWPMLGELMPGLLSTRWSYLTGGSWHKTGGLGIGYHVRGDSEPFLLLRKGKPQPYGTLSNAWASPRERHSEKPTGPTDPSVYTGLCAVMRAFTAPDDLVLSIYSGLCPEARAAKLTGRRLIGAELDPQRHHQALCLLAAERHIR